MKELLDTLEAWRRDGVPVGRAVVVRTYGSAPRREGSVLLSAPDGRLAGSVSGGCVEGAAAEEIGRAIASGRSRVVRYGISDDLAWSVGLACGGTIDVLIEPGVAPEVADAARSTGGTAVVTPLPPESGAPPAARLVVGSDGRLEGTSGDGDADGAIVVAAREALLRATSSILEAGGHEYFVEAFPVRARLVIVGAVEIARSLVRLARELGFETVVIDGRPAFATAERFPDADQLIVGWPDEVADAIGLGPDDAVAVLAHDPKFDEPAIVAALHRRCRYVGAIGSRKTQAERRERLRANGVAEEELARLRGPIGLDLGGRSPAETALAVLAEIVAERYGASAASLTR